MNEKNLVKFTDLPKEQHLELSRLGGLASAKARKEKALLKNNLELLLETGLTQEQEQILKAQGVQEDNLNLSTLISYRLIERALTGEPRAVELVAHLTQQDIESQARLKEVDIRERTLALKETTTQQEIGDKVVFIEVNSNSNLESIKDALLNQGAKEENIIVHTITDK